MISKRKRGGLRISREVKTLIISQAIHDSKTMPRRALAVRLQELIQRMGEVSPTEDTLVRMISAARNQQPSELERPWSIGACSQYGIPAEIVPLLIKVRQSRILTMKGRGKNFKDMHKQLSKAKIGLGIVREGRAG